MNEPRTHAKKPDLGSLETSPEAKQLVEDLQDVLKCEEMWYIAEQHLNNARQATRKTIEEQYAAIRAGAKDLPSPYDPEGILNALLD